MWYYLQRWTSLSLCSPKLTFKKDGEGNTFSFLTLLNEHTKPCMWLVPFARHEQNAGGLIRTKCTSKVYECQKQTPCGGVFENSLQWWAEFQDWYVRRKEIRLKRMNSMIEKVQIWKTGHVRWIEKGICWSLLEMEEMCERTEGCSYSLMCNWKLLLFVSQRLCWYDLYSI